MCHCLGLLSKTYVNFLAFDLPPCLFNVEKFQITASLLFKTLVEPVAGLSETSTCAAETTVLFAQFSQFLNSNGRGW